LDERRGGLGLILPIARRVIEHPGGEEWSPPSEKSASGRKARLCSRSRSSPSPDP
jgi:hypothetical protein